MMSYLIASAVMVLALLHLKPSFRNFPIDDEDRELQRALFGLSPAQRNALILWATLVVIPMWPFITLGAIIGRASKEQ